jgi:hypothetical protein
MSEETYKLTDEQIRKLKEFRDELRKDIHADLNDKQSEKAYYKAAGLAQTLNILGIDVYEIFD